MALGVGDALPEFSLKDQNGKGSLASPRSATGGWCCSSIPRTTPPDARPRPAVFAITLPSFRALNAEVWGISGDDRRQPSDASQPATTSDFPLLSDKNNALRRSMGVPKAIGLLPGRVTYVVDPKGVIRHVFSNLLDGPAHVREAQRIIKHLQN